MFALRIGSRGRQATLTSAIRKMSTNVRSTAASGSMVYESKRAVDEYLLFHYGGADLLMPYSFGPTDALNFAERVAAMAVARHGKPGEDLRALDIGCAVGGLSFALAKHAKEVVGLDFSQHFVDAANEMKALGNMNFRVLKQGTIFFDAVAEVPASIDRSRATFVRGDACNLDSQLGGFDIIVASNLLCRLPDPQKFLQEVPRLLKPGGVLVMVSPYSWLDEYTARENWIGARDSDEDSWRVVQRVLGSNSNVSLRLEHQEEVPFIIREHERKFQYGVSHGSVWRRV